MESSGRSVVIHFQLVPWSWVVQSVRSQICNECFISPSPLSSWLHELRYGSWSWAYGSDHCWYLYDCLLLFGCGWLSLIAIILEYFLILNHQIVCYRRLWTFNIVPYCCLLLGHHHHWPSWITTVPGRLAETASASDQDKGAFTELSAKLQDFAKRQGVPLEKKQPLELLKESDGGSRREVMLAHTSA